MSPEPWAQDCLCHSLVRDLGRPLPLAESRSTSLSVEVWSSDPDSTCVPTILQSPLGPLRPGSAEPHSALGLAPCGE